MAVLFVQNWDIIEGREDDYSSFIAERYIPVTTSMGFVSVGGFYVEVGFGPRIIAVLSVDNVADLSRMVSEKRLKTLNLELKGLVENYRANVLEPTGRVKHEKYTIQRGVWKLNQYYDIRPGKKEAYAEFILHEHLPTMQNIAYVEVTGGWNVLFGGGNEVIAEFTFRNPADIGRLLADDEFQRITTRLKRVFVHNYASKILRCTERFDQHKWSTL
jgi:hypothetical protein